MAGVRLIAVDTARDAVAHPVSRLAELVLAVLVVTCTFVTTERGMGGDRRYPIMLGLLGGSLLVCLLLWLLRWLLARRTSSGDRRPDRPGRRAALAVAGPFLAMLVWAGCTIAWHDHFVLAGRTASHMTRVEVPTSALVVPLLEAGLALLSAAMLVLLIGRGRLADALWRICLVLAVVTPADLLREYFTEPPVGWRLATRFGGAAIYHTALILGIGVAADGIRRRHHQVLSWLIVASFVLALIASGSRAGFIDLGLFCVALLIWGRPARIGTRHRHLLKGIIGFLVAAAAVLWIGQLRGVGLVDHGRSQTWRVAWENITDSFGTAILGKGYGVMWPWFATESGQVPGASHALRVTGYGVSLPHAHNTLVQIAAELGLLGLILALASFVAVVVYCLRGIGGFHGATCLAVLATFPGLILDTYLVKNFPTSLMWWVVAISMAVVMSGQGRGRTQQGRPHPGGERP
ncbi:MAG: O-antigen ligase family protein [Acidipropionibacterium sp.]|jgi:O-antigen ligase|nr:O-antigen ligase family protein [Acidipropionibacterium sp.]